MIGLRPARQVELRPWRELAVHTLIAMELGWIALWYANLTQINHPVSYGRAYLVLGGLLLASHWLARALRLETQRAAARRAIDLALLLVGLWLTLELLLYLPEWLGPASVWQRIAGGFAQKNTIPAEFWVLLAALLVWNRGIGVARQVVSADRSLASFQMGVLMFALYGITIPFLPLSTALAAMFAFLLLGLISMSAARIYENGRGRGGKLAGFNRAWLVGIGLAALLVVAIGIVPAWLLPPGLAQFAIRYLMVGLGLVLALAALLVSPVIIVILIAIQAVGPYLVKVFDLFQFSQALKTLQNLGIPGNLENPLERVAVAKPVTLWAILVLVVFVILAGLSWRTWLERKPEVEDGELLLSGTNLLRWLRGRLRAGANPFRRQGRLGRASQILAVARVRWIYAQLMRLCARLDHPRPPARTPLEFLPELEGLFPDQQRALAEITQAYVRVRYGEAPETALEVEQLAEDWKQVSRSARTNRNRKPKQPDKGR